ncbi:hypothetical protein TBLA_0A07460 [Henningerozyma blattae CBS 6284]|uniref:non-specific serine/threonine protein kinase n=1 Tax=Henningerozyma blattae (strain ATCC 34711 / CBS 6284 / DSM 70876 / NBRC 10599 / NRRL Y-10934 / UCD 77-7) TaxID=1071380 RepID=I2GWN4_HENB6|nr:hypothetical protein TBLA_0A07460 [Tetrapisispora blattae CBS 6284]CCH58536.1 hypothetical protein TBLA_0A07460 [Tetrapisispora blattae CBS 6284]
MSQLYKNPTQPSSLFLMEKCVGRGNFGDVYKAVEIKSGKIVAIKVVNLEHTNEDIELLSQEIFFLAELRSPYVTKYLTTLLEDVSIWIVMEYCGGGSCADLIKYAYKRGLPENKASFITKEVLKGLRYLHEQKKIHRDIKAANILLTDDGMVKLGDFGVSGQIKATLKKDTFVGTPYWMAPEVVKKDESGYNEKADIWSLGITVYELLKGCPPLAKYDPMKVMISVPKRRAPKLHGHYSEDAKSFISHCLIKDPNARPNAKTLSKFPFVNHNEISHLKSDVDYVKKLESERKYLKNPKFPLNNKVYDNCPGTVEWDFDPGKTLSNKANKIIIIAVVIAIIVVIMIIIITKIDYLIIITNIILEEIYKIGQEAENSPISPSSNNISPISPAIGNLETPLTSHGTISFRKYDNHNINNVNIYNTNNKQNNENYLIGEQGVTCQQRMQDPRMRDFDYMTNVIFFSFKRMNERANDDVVRSYVLGMLNKFESTEEKVPGFCQIFIEEVAMRMDAINDYLK